MFSGVDVGADELYYEVHLLGVETVSEKMAKVPFGEVARTLR